MITSINTNKHVTRSNPNFKATIPIKGVYITDALNTNAPASSNFTQTFNPKDFESIVRDLKKVLFKKDNANETNPLFKNLNDNIRQVFEKGNGNKKEYCIFEDPNNYVRHDKRFRHLQTLKNKQYILTGNQAKAVDTTGANVGKAKADIKKMGGSDQAVESSPKVRKAKDKYIGAINKALKKIAPQGISIYGERKPSGSIKVVGINFN